MSIELTRTTDKVARRRWGFEANTIAFPRALRDAIPDLPTCAGRVLKLDSISGTPPDSSMFGRRVCLNLVARETGKLTGEYTVRIDLDPEAALALADTLRKLATEN
ncbi:MAG TPA: hypothetical protein VGF49_01780 [Candidatus Solibacter sp.]|jgi:hypothetical protein